MLNTKEIEGIYSQGQTLSYFKVKYKEKLDLKELKETIKRLQEKTGKDFSYLFDSLEEEKNISLFDVMTKVNQDDVQDFAKILLLIQNKNLGKQQVETKLAEYMQDMQEILKLQGSLGNIDNLTNYIKQRLHRSLRSTIKGEEELNSDELEELLFSNDKDNKENSKNGDNEKDSLDENLEEIADNLAYFQKVRKFYKKFAYVITPREAVMIEDILEDLKKGRLVTLLGETGSGKTELARFICGAYLGKEPVVVSGSRYLTDEDFTLEKIVTSKSLLDTGKIEGTKESGLTEEEFLRKTAEQTFEKIVKSAEFKNILKEKAGDKHKDEIENLNPLEYNLFTEYHLVGLFKGMVEGRPVILDEINLIKPEVVMALNDYFTRRVGDKIELPNGLGKIKIKKGFNIILTGNDSEATLNERYTQGRYKFDEATYNRLSVYAKNYYNQTTKKFDSDTETGDVIEYMNNNELYGILLMMLFDHKKNPFGIELKKEGFAEMINTKEKKEKIFQDLQKFAQATAMIQKAYAGETITLKRINTDISVHNEITRKVLTMRNIKDVLEDWIKGKHSLEYYVYKNFAQKEVKEDEKFAVLAIFHEVGFFEHLVGDNKDETFEALQKWYQEKREKKLSAMGKEDNQISPDNEKQKVVINKYDILKEYFGKKTGFLDMDEEQLEEIKQNFQEEKESEETSFDVDTNLSEEELRDAISTSIKLFTLKYNETQRLLIDEYWKKVDELDKEYKNKEKDDAYYAKLRELQEEYHRNKKIFTAMVGYLESGGIDELEKEELKEINNCFSKVSGELISYS